METNINEQLNQNEIVATYEYFENKNTHNLENLEFSKEETETEIEYIEQTLNKFDLIKNELPLKSTAREQIEIFITKLKTEHESNEQILNEINQSIEFVRGY